MSDLVHCFCTEIHRSPIFLCQSWGISVLGFHCTSLLSFYHLPPLISSVQTLQDFSNRSIDTWKRLFLLYLCLSQFKDNQFPSGSQCACRQPTGVASCLHQPLFFASRLFGESVIHSWTVELGRFTLLSIKLSFRNSDVFSLIIWRSTVTLKKPEYYPLLCVIMAREIIILPDRWQSLADSSHHQRCTVQITQVMTCVKVGGRQTQRGSWPW